MKVTQAGKRRAYSKRALMRIRMKADFNYPAWVMARAADKAAECLQALGASWERVRQGVERAMVQLAKQLDKQKGVA